MESGKRNAEEMEAKGTSLTVSKRRKKVEEEKKELTSWEKEVRVKKETCLGTKRVGWNELTRFVWHVSQGILRTSKLEAPTMLLSGHKVSSYPFAL